MHDVVTQVILYAWYAGMAARAWCLWSLLRKRANLPEARFCRIYPALTAFMVVTLSRSLWLLWAHMTGGGEAYAPLWHATEWMEFAMLLSVSVEIFVHIVRHFRGAIGFALVVALVFGAVSALTCFLMAGISGEGVPYSRLIPWARHTTLGLLLLLVPLWGFFHALPQEMRANVNAHVGILGVYLMTNGVSAVTAYGTSAWKILTSQMVLACGSLLAYVLWATSFSVEGERFTPVSECTVEEDAAAARKLDAFADEVSELRRAETKRIFTRR